MDSGAVTNLKKPFYTGKTVTSICVGDQELYDFINENPDVWVGPSSVTCDIAFVMQHPNMIAINAALMVDLSSQAACEGVGHMMISGSGGQLEFVVGSHYAQNGRSLTVLPAASMRNGQLVSNIVPDFEPGTPVTVPRTYVDYVVTEYGIARMRDKTRIERAKALIEIAHPDFRGELRDSMKSFFYPKHWADRD
jgi:4-hydroxybutyrate CoA-transferase